MKTIRHSLLAVLLLAGASFAHAQGDAPLQRRRRFGAIAMVKTKPGLTDDYLKQLKPLFVGELEEAKKAGLIVSYKILLGTYATPQGL